MQDVQKVQKAAIKTDQISKSLQSFSSKNLEFCICFYFQTLRIHDFINIQPHYFLY